MTPSFIHGNALAIPLADKSVHLICTSPPYFALRSYRDDGEHFDGQIGSEETPLHFLIALWSVLDECWRVLRDDGSCWINLGDKFAGSGGHNNAGISRHGTGSSTLQGNGKPDVARRSDLARKIKAQPKATRRSAPDRYNQESAGLLDKSQMMLPHLFAAGCQYPWLRRAIEAEAGVEPAEQPRQWIMRKEVIWAKTNGLPESVTDRVRSAHEQWFHLVKRGTYFAALDEIREEYTPGTAERYEAGYSRIAVSATGQSQNPVLRADGGGPSQTNPLGKVPGSWWAVPTEPLRMPEFMVPSHPGDMHPLWLDDKKAAQRWMRREGVCSSPWPRQPEDGHQLRVAPSHFAAFPSEFPRRITLGWSPLGGTVLDPFSGTGTTSIVAAALGRHAIGVELSADYLRLAHWRAEESDLAGKAWAKTAGVKLKPRKKERPNERSGSLFGLLET